jgi:hypothetical protein
LRKTNYDRYTNGGESTPDKSKILRSLQPEMKQPSPLQAKLAIANETLKRHNVKNDDILQKIIKDKMKENLAARVATRRKRKERVVPNKQSQP